MPTAPRNDRYLPPELRKLVRKARHQGWEVSPTRGLHIRWKSPDGRTIVVMAGTASDSRSVKNALVMLRKAGLKQ